MNKLILNKVEKDIKKAKDEGAEFIIVFLHWGREYQLIESNYQINWVNTF
jgi:poly-gamma-glutamate capsule biosynthesis protein CapA/YwtB (metallophosphatase superfamily)